MRIYRPASFPETTEIRGDELTSVLETLNLREVLRPEGPAVGASCLETALDSWVFGGDSAGRQILENYKLLSWDGCGLSDEAAGDGGRGRGAWHYYLRDVPGRNRR